MGSYPVWGIHFMKKASEMEANKLDQIDPKLLGEQLFEARKKASLTQADAATILDVARTTITAIEAGERRIKPLELFKLASAYRQDPSSFGRPRPKIQPI